MTIALIKLAVIDGDMVAWDNRVRMAVADQAAQLVAETIDELQAKRKFTLDERHRKRLVEAARWRVAFNPDLIELDRHIPNSIVSMELLASAGWQVVIMSSNPETTRERRAAWLTARGYALSPLILKDTGDDEDAKDRFVTTPDWKVLQVRRIIEQHGGAANIDALLFVDDSDKNRIAIQQAFGNEEMMSVIVTDSLDLAVMLFEGRPGHIEYPIREEG